MLTVYRVEDKNYATVSDANNCRWQLVDGYWCTMGTPRSPMAMTRFSELKWVSAYAEEVKVHLSE